MEWLKNLSNAIEYIESHLDTEISYEEAARIACCSTYYFQRLFSYVAGISLSEYIRKAKSQTHRRRADNTQGKFTCDYRFFFISIYDESLPRPMGKEKNRSWAG